MSREETGVPKLMTGVVGKQASGQAEGAGPATSLHQYESCGAWVVAACGAYDMDAIPPLAEALNAAVRNHAKVVLDASGVDFADSSFLNLLILAHQTGTLRVAAPQEQLRRLLEITGIDTVLAVRETVYDAALS